ncbi:MAG: hypothetical protein ABIJ56_24625 [Pseudomonadota bacterium]
MPDNGKIKTLLPLLLPAALLLLPSITHAFAGSPGVQHKKAVRAAIGKNFTSLADCLEQFATTYPEVEEVSLEFLVWTNGQLYNVKISPGDGQSEQCIENVLKQISMPLPDEPSDYNFKINLDSHVRKTTEKSIEARKDVSENKLEKDKKRVRRHSLAMDLLHPVVTAAMGIGYIFLFEYEIAINRWVALTVVGLGGKIKMEHSATIHGQEIEGTIEGSGGGGGGGIRVFPLGKAPSGLILGVRVQSYLFKAKLDECPEGEEEKCSGEIKNLDLMAEVGWRFVMRYGFAVLLTADVGAQWGRSLLQFDSDPAFFAAGKVAVGWSF